MSLWMLCGAVSFSILSLVLLSWLRPELARMPLLLGWLVAALPLMAVSFYPGTATLSSRPVMLMPAVRTGGMPAPKAAVMQMDLGKLAEQLAAKLQANPANGDGWALLARTYVELKRHADAVPAFDKAVALLPRDSHLLADYADALAISQGGHFDKKCVSLLEQALQLDPMNVKALMLKASKAFNEKDYPAAIASWEKILTAPNLTAEAKMEATGSIAEARRLMGKNS